MKALQIYERDGKEFTLPYHLPEKRQGRFSVTVAFEPVGARLPVVSMRNAFFMGLPMVNYVVNGQPLGIHKLKDGKGTWMTTMPQEIEQHHRQLKRMHGHVLVGGLGLGLAVALLEANDNVTEITVVEKSFEVLHLVGPHVPKSKTKIVRGDLFDYLAQCKRKGQTFDCAFYDIWAPTGETVLKTHVLPLRKLSQGIVPQKKIENWNEDEMIGQIVLNCQTNIMMTNQGTDIPSHLDINEACFQSCKKGMGLSWYYDKWLRKQKRPLNKEVAMAKLLEYKKDLKDIAALESKWEVNV